MGSMGGTTTLVSGTAASQAGTGDNVQLGNGEIASMTAASGVSTPLVFAPSFSPLDHGALPVAKGSRVLANNLSSNGKPLTAVRATWSAPGPWSCMATAPLCACQRPACSAPTRWPQSLLRSGRAKEGLAVLAHLVKETPTNPYVHFQLAYPQANQGKLDAAMGEYRQAKPLASISRSESVYGPLAVVEARPAVVNPVLARRW
jgi:hypothetical protein